MGIYRIVFCGTDLVKFRSLETLDQDYKTAKRDWLVALIIWLPALALEVINVFRTTRL